ncbi:uncharacterized protein [Littorina saxatilis]|uniref:Uncharacterized protein n=1 Tax=Littorina saxatilis TaxID=31220 RepID=A0AAN9B0Y9_9CAEN
MEKRVLCLALLMLSGYTARGGDCDTTEADDCVESIPTVSNQTSHQELCSVGISFLRCLNAACDGPPYPSQYQLYVDGMKRGMASAGIECDYTRAGASSLQTWTGVIVLVAAVGLLLRG